MYIDLTFIYKVSDITYVWMHDQIIAQAKFLVKNLFKCKELLLLFLEGPDAFFPHYNSFVC